MPPADIPLRTAPSTSHAPRIWYNQRFAPRKEVQVRWPRARKSETVFLVCKETGDYNYTLKRKTGGEKLTLQKYCPRCRKHTEHTEKKK